MNHIQPAGEPDVDAMMRDMKRAKRTPLFIGLGIVGALVLAFGFYVISGRAAAASELTQRGYSQTKLTMNDPFTWGFTGRKGTSECGGTFQRVPFSTSITESCFDTSPPAPKAPVRPEHEVLADGFRSLLAGLSTSPITTQCNRIEPGATSATCTATTEGHPPVEVIFAKKGEDWTMDRPSRILSKNGLGDSISKELREKTKKPSVVDCGTGLMGYSEGDTLTCTASRPGLKKPASVAVTFGAKDAYTWKVTGI